MNIMLLGNGFDIHYLLPTKYINFLHVVDFLTLNYDKNMTTVGDVFRNPKLQNDDFFIAESYKKYKELYDRIPLADTDILTLIDLAKNNIWYKYLLDSYNADIGWIDFEKEISKICQVFLKLFHANVQSEADSPIYYELYDLFKDPVDAYLILKHFSFWGCPVGINTLEVTKEYELEKAIGSGYKILNKEALSGQLYNELENLSQMLNIYMISFIDNTTPHLVKEKKINRLNIPVEYAITLNYTHTFEEIYQSMAMHVHGSTGRAIVLGVNSDSTDELLDTDTTFIRFKKYFQRVLYQTDIGYLNFIKQINNQPEEYAAFNKQKIELFVMGHSLDITDQEIIKQLFSLSDKITILCHNESAINSYIPNLIKIYGKNEFDYLRNNKSLTFKMIDYDVADILLEEKKKLEAEECAKKEIETLQLVY